MCVCINSNADGLTVTVMISITRYSCNICSKTPPWTCSPHPEVHPGVSQRPHEKGVCSPRACRQWSKYVKSF